MLKDILRSINTSGYISRSKLASELDVSGDIVDEGIRQLIRMGFLIKEETGEDCSVVCASCPYAKTCNKDIINTYKITDKGNKIL